MAYSEDIKSVFKEDGLSPVEVSLYGSRALVISGHKGLSSISEEEIVVRRKRGSIRVCGSDLKVEKASPDELFLSGEIRVVEFLPPRSEGKS